MGAELARTSKRQGAWRRKAGKALFYGWLLFSHADDFQANLEASGTIIHEVSEWAQDARNVIAPDRLELLSGRIDTAHEDGDLDIVEAEVLEEPDL